MPANKDLRKILLIGSGPIVIGQACEFDYSGVQACRALREEGCKVVLVNSNPATIMTDPQVTDTTYLEPLVPAVLQRIIQKEKPDAILPTMGGQTALNLTMHLRDFLRAKDVAIIGAGLKTIETAEDRDAFAKAMHRIGLKTPPAAVAKNMHEALAIGDQLGFPIIARPSFTLGGSGGGIAFNREEFLRICHNGFQLSPIHTIQLDKSLIGWKEYELEVVRDRKDNCIIICSIENVDPMGIHTGDSITVAPCQTLTDKEYQQMRNAAINVLREVGVETGGANVQFAVNPQTGEQLVIEMNPRVSRSSALASKATGFPIARVAAKLALGYTLDELLNAITGDIIPASFEPTLDYVVTKIPRFDFAKFDQADDRLTTQMKSVGEVMAIGRNFNESLQKALCGLEHGFCGLNAMCGALTTDEDLARELRSAGPNRLLFMADALRRKWSIDKVQHLTGIDPWFIAHLQQLVRMEDDLKGTKLHQLRQENLRAYKREGFSDERLAQLLGSAEDKVRARRHRLGIVPVYKRVDSCAAEFPAASAYLYSTYDTECEAQPSAKKKVVILGSGPNRIGQGIEFDYCCVHVTRAVRDAGSEAIMINCNPETVSTDYDISDKLYFEPLTLEHTLEVIRREDPDGTLVQYGGQTPLKLAMPLAEHGVKLLGTSAEVIHKAENREEFRRIIKRLKLKQPRNATFTNTQKAIAYAARIGYPLMVRPSYVLGGQAMQVVFNKEELSEYFALAVKVSGKNPVLLDSFLDRAIEVDVDAVSDGQKTFIGGIMQHIEEAGVHSGDSSSCIPPHSLPAKQVKELARQTRLLAQTLGVRGLLNIQFAIQDKDIYVLEINPRASRTTPFISKVIGISLPYLAAQIALGTKMKARAAKHSYYAVKESVFPFNKFPGTDPILGPEMKSTGEVMGIGRTFAEAYYKASLAAGMNIDALRQQKQPRVFISVRDKDKLAAVVLARRLIKLGFDLVATSGTGLVLHQHKVAHNTINKVYEGSPHIVDMIKNNQIHFIVNTCEGKQSVADSASIRTQALQNNLCYTTTLGGCASLIEALEKGSIRTMHALQEIIAQPVKRQQ